MNKSELIDRVSEKSGLPRKKAEAVVNMIFDSMTESLVRGERIEIRGFGSFVSKHYRARMGRNPRTGETIPVPAKRLPFFKVGKELREMVDYNEKPNASAGTGAGSSDASPASTGGGESPNNA